MKRQNNNTSKLNEQRIGDKREFRYSVMEETGSRNNKHNEDTLNEKEILEILGDLQTLTIEKVQDLLSLGSDKGNISLITGNVNILLLIAEKNKDLLNALGYEKNKKNGLSKIKRD